MTHDSFGTAARRRLTLRRDKAAAVKNRHPWIFAGAIGAEAGPPDAPLADLFDADGTRIASGFHSPVSQIRLRALTWGEEALTEELIRARIAAAVARRRSQVLNETTNAARVVNAEGDELSGLVVDRYADVAVVEIANRGLEQLGPLVADVLRQELAPRVLYFKNDLPPRKLEQLPLEAKTVGEGEPATTILENGLRFRVDPSTGQKTGFFLDQRENRQLARTLAAGRRVLNLFAYTGGFGVYTAAGGATSVVNVDVSARAVELSRVNHDLNGVEGAEHVVADAFAYVRERSAARERFGMVLCDPPAFAKSRREVERAARGYKDINLQALRLVEPGGWLMTWSCSGHVAVDLFQKIVFAAALDANRRVSFVRRLTAGVDHPVSLFCPEGEYLKGFLLRVD